MAQDSFTEVTGQSWFSRLFDSIKSVLLGIVLFVVAFPVLFWNEGRAVRTAKSLAEGASAVVSVPADTVNAANEGKLVHMTGDATTAETLSDPEFGVSAPAIKLKRRVEMYQWEEQKKSQSKTKLGGGTETVTTYTYRQAWSPSLIDSSSFKHSEGHENARALPVASETWTAEKVTLGAFTLAGAQVGLLDKSEDFSVDEKAAGALPPDMKERAKLASGGYYLGGDPASPAIGDTKVSFQIVPPAAVSIVARQIGSTFEAYQAKAGGSILLLDYGTLSADSMFKSAEEANAAFTWILRVAGFLLMALGLFLVFRPIAVFADVLPILGSFLGMGIGLFAGVVAACLTLVTIAVSWLFFRPLVGIALLLVAAGGIAGLIHLARQRRAKRKQQMPETPAPAA
jgi:hypothetical protein